MNNIRVAVIGAGYWGPNLIRNFSACPTTDLVAVCDRDHERLQRVLTSYPAVRGVTSADELLSDPSLDAVAIATPVATHAPLALQALAAGKHVLVEKPLAASVDEATAMVEEARRYNRVLMVDHTFLFSSPVRKIKELIDAGELGDLNFIDSVRINLGLFQNDVNVLCDLAPHDLSIVDFIVGRLPESLSAIGKSHTKGNKQLEDVAYLHLDFGGDLLASFHVNWLSPVKLRHFMIGGSQKSLVFNDLEPSEKIRVYDKGITVEEDLESRRGVLVGYRTGDVWSPHLPQSEPLQEMVRHFADCIRNGTEPICNGEAGLRIVRLLAAAGDSLTNKGTAIRIA